MKERTRNVIVGLTALAGIVGLAGMSVLFGGLPRLLEGGYPITVEMPSAGGLTQDSRVHLAGIDIGYVSQVELAKPPKTGVTITIKIREEVRIPKAADVSVKQGLIGGSPTLLFDIEQLTAAQATDYLANDGSAEVQGSSASMVNALAAQMREALKGPTEKFAQLADNFQELSKEWSDVGRNIKQMTAARTSADVDAGNADANLPSILDRADQRLKQMELVIAGLNEWINDPQIRSDIKATVANAKALTERANASMDKVDAVLTNADKAVATTNDAIGNAGKRVDEIAAKYGKVADELTVAITSMRQTIELARKGDGTVGKMLNDPALYNNLNDTVERMGQALKEMKMMFEKWQKEGLPVKL